MAGCWACSALTPEDLTAPCRHCGRTGEEPPEFTAQDLGLIMGMCMNANPWFPDKPMIPAWQSVYDTANAVLERRGLYITAERY